MEEEKRAAAADWPPSASITSGLVYSMLAIGISAGPALAGWLFDVTGSYAAGFVFRVEHTASLRVCV